MVKPFLKWAGGKRQLLPEIRKYIPDFNVYFEPFLGAGAVLFDLQPQEAVVSDSNDQLIMAYKAIRDDFSDVSKILDGHVQRYCEEYFYKVRELDRDKDTFSKLGSAEIAARLIFLNKTCFNGLYRVNSQGLFNVPFGRYKNPAINEETTLKAVCDYLNNSNVEFLNCDFEETVQTANKGDFVYFDPPYHSPDNTSFTGYQAGRFSEMDQERLYECFSNLTNTGIKCLLSNSATDYIRNLYRDFDIVTIPAKRLINTKAQGRGFIDELLIKNW